MNRPLSSLAMAALLWALVAPAVRAGDGGGPGFGDEDGPRARASLLAETVAARPGGTLAVGVRIVLDDHWHLYWTNPGDSGVPPEVKWSLPAAWKAGPLRWPAPGRIPTDPFMTFGYEKELLLLCDIDVPADAKEGDVTLTAKVHWLVCRDVCLDGGEEVSLTLPVAAGQPGANAAHGDLFRRTRASLPRAAPEGAFHARAGDGTVTLRLAGEPFLGAGAARPWYFPAAPGEVEPSAPQDLAREDGAVALALRPAVEADGLPERLRGIVVVSTDEGRRAWIVDVPVEPVEAKGDGREKDSPGSGK